jgi:hypothetical protein
MLMTLILGDDAKIVTSLVARYHSGRFGEPPGTMPVRSDRKRMVGRDGLAGRRI